METLHHRPDHHSVLGCKRERPSLVLFLCWVTLHRQSLKLGTSKRRQLRELFCQNSGNPWKTRRVSLCSRKRTGPSRWLMEKMVPQSDSQTVIDSLAIIIDSHSVELLLTLKGKPAIVVNCLMVARCFLTWRRVLCERIVPDAWHIVSLEDNTLIMWLGSLLGSVPKSTRWVGGWGE